MKITNDWFPLPQEHQHIHLDSSKWSNELPATLTMCLTASYWLSKLFYIRLWFGTNTNVGAILNHAYRTWQSNLSVWQLPLNPKCCSASYLVGTQFKSRPENLSSWEKFLVIFFRTSTTNPSTSFQVITH